MNWSKCRAVVDKGYEEARNILIPVAMKYANRHAGPDLSTSSHVARWNLCYLGEMDRLANLFIEPIKQILANKDIGEIDRLSKIRGLVD